MTKTIEVQATEFSAACEAHLQAALNGDTIIVIVDGQPTLQLSNVHPGGQTYNLSAMDFACSVADYALLTALHGRNYRLSFIAGTVFVTRSVGYYSDFLDKWERAWADEHGVTF